MKFTMPFTRIIIRSLKITHDSLKADVIHERLFALGGMGIAATISAIAYYEAHSNQGIIAINGADHFAVFAKPALYHEERIRVAELATVPPPSLYDPIGRPADAPAGPSAPPPADLPGSAPVSIFARSPVNIDYETTASIATMPAPLPLPRMTQTFANSVTTSLPAMPMQHWSGSLENRMDILKKSTGQPYTLQSVSERFAIFRNGDGKIMVRSGEKIPGVGRMNAIVKRQGRWVAVITKE